MDSLERAPDALPTLDDVSQDASGDACASSLEYGVPSKGSPTTIGVNGEALSDIVVASSFSARLANACPRRQRLPNWLMLG